MNEPVTVISNVVILDSAGHVYGGGVGRDYVPGDLAIMERPAHLLSPMQLRERNYLAVCNCGRRLAQINREGCSRAHCSVPADPLLQRKWEECLAAAQAEKDVADQPEAGRGRITAIPEWAPDDVDGPHG